MQHTTICITATDGVRLSVERWTPEGSPAAVIHLIHGMAEHAACYSRLAASLTARGWEVWADDHRGHGKTAGSVEAAGVFADHDGWEVVLNDQLTVMDAERAEHPGLPLVVIGHSLGSIIARDVAIRWGERLAAMVLSGVSDGLGALAPLARTLANREAAKGPSLPSPRLHAMSFLGFNKQFRPNRSDYDWLSRDPEEVDAYIADPMCGFICSAGFFRDTLTGLSRATDLRLLAAIPAGLPVLVEGGGADPVSKNGRGTRAVAASLRQAGVDDVTCVIYEGARHEIFNETNRDAIVRLTAEWIASTLAAGQAPKGTLSGSWQFGCADVSIPSTHPANVSKL